MKSWKVNKKIVRALDEVLFIKTLSWIRIRLYQQTQCGCCIVNFDENFTAQQKNKRNDNKKINIAIKILYLSLH